MWFSASLLFEFVHLDSSKKNIWEEQIILLFASNKEDAVKKANDFGRKQETEYTPAENPDRDIVKVTFRQIESICVLDDIVDLSDVSDELKEVFNENELFFRFLQYDTVKKMLDPFPDD